MWLFSLLACGLEGPANPAATEEVLFEVPKGATARGLGPALETAGLVEASWKWEGFLRMGADGSCIKAGPHKASARMTAPELLSALCGVPVPKDEPFTVLEGWRVRDIDAALAAKGWIVAGAYLAAAGDVAKEAQGAFKLDEAGEYTMPVPKDNLEGYLYPETYKVEPDHFSARGFVERQLQTFNARFYNKAQREIGKEGGRTLSDIVIMASLIEREEANPANRPLIAGILWKRIDSGWELGVDATSRYTLDDWNDRQAFLKKLRDPGDPWNTRLKKGLPPTAIGNPGIVALQAAMGPEDSAFWYYLHDSSGTLHPSKDVAEHEAYRRKYDVY